ncbi:MAG: hypothetical protein DI586_05575 [Micavibrio aeruginosavorus]|uniref:Polysaccharide lyase family 7 protein n=1 Tax=Micavibrio aeruginosavorus TaxID=349221 RepID=A0A2W5FLG9_9BACT|nr:MAG: hypothetical protein DI586_05575 [Micavibrio aeruginosavorus]
MFGKIMLRFFNLSIFLLLVFSFSGMALAGQDPVVKAKLARFFGVDADRIWLECSQDSFSLDEEDGQSVLNVCLREKDRKQRCEISVHRLSLAPVVNHISFEFKHIDATRRSRWETLMQIHSFPDKGEKWRCPVAPLEIINGTLRMMSRWDSSPMSQPVGYSCAGAGSTVSTREFIKDIPLIPGKWQKVDLATKLSYKDDGTIRLKIDNKDSGLITGPNRYNDEKLPFVKFGIYKPTGWEKGHVSTCTRYRNVKIVSGDN